MFLERILQSRNITEYITGVAGEKRLASHQMN